MEAVSQTRSAICREEKNMKIAMMTNNYLPFIAGVPISIERLSEGLRKEGHEVVIFAPDYKGQKEDEQVVRYRSLIKGVSGGASVPDSFDRRIEKEFAKGNFDVIHVQHPMMIGWTAVYLSRKYNVPLVFTYHTRYEQYLHYIKASALKKFLPLFMREYTKYCDVVLAPTPLMKDYLEEIGCPAKVEVLPTGLMEGSYMPDEAKAKKLREELLGDSGKKYVFCTIARLAKEKNLDFLFRVLAARKERKQGSDFKFAIIGDGPERQELERLAKELDLREEICFVGKVPNEEVKHYCRAADYFLFSSLSETQGIVLLEAMAAGLPVIAVRASGVSDIVVNGENGYMTALSEIEFERRLDMTLENDSQRSHLVQGAFQTAKMYRAQDIAGLAAVYYKAAVAEHEQNGKDEEKSHGIRNRRRTSDISV